MPGARAHALGAGWPKTSALPRERGDPGFFVRVRAFAPFVCFVVKTVASPHDPPPPHPRRAPGDVRGGGRRPRRRAQRRGHRRYRGRAKRRRSDGTCPAPKPNFSFPLWEIGDYYPIESDGKNHWKATFARPVEGGRVKGLVGQFFRKDPLALDPIDLPTLATVIKLFVEPFDRRPRQTSN